MKQFRLLATILMLSGTVHADLTDVPQEHRYRVWWTPERVQRLQTWWQTHAFTPRNDDPYDLSLAYVATGNAAYARTVIGMLNNFTVPAGQLAGVASDEYRWATWIGFALASCGDQMTAQERTNFITKYNGYTDNVLNKSWGGPGMENNNYYWGYLTNALGFALASYHENPQALSIINRTVAGRWETGALPFLANQNKGGLPGEAFAYGSTSYDYPIVSFMTAHNLNRPMFDETNWFVEGVYALIHGVTYHSPSQIFTFNDDEIYDANDAPAAGVAGRTALGNFMLNMAGLWSSEAVGQYARQWVNLVDPNIENYIRAVDAGGTARSFNSLPTDYYTSGFPSFFTRNNWSSEATVAFLQGGTATRVGHKQADNGNISIYKGKDAMLFEDVGYVENTLLGYETDDPRAHNSFLVGNAGVINYQGRGIGSTLRLESQSAYSRVVMDLTDVYRSNDSRFDRPFIQRATRELVFIKALDAFVMVDKAATTSNAAVTSIFHTPGQPTVLSPTRMRYAGSENTLDIYSFSPSGSVAMNTQREHQGNNVWRTDAVGTHGLLIHVLALKGNSESDTTVQVLSEDDDNVAVEVANARGTAVVTLNKGLQNFNGALGFTTATGAAGRTAAIAASAAFYDNVQHMAADKTGVRWLPFGSNPPAPPPTGQPRGEYNGGSNPGGDSGSDGSDGESDSSHSETESDQIRRLLAKPGQPAEIHCNGTCQITVLDRFGTERLKKSGSGTLTIPSNALPSGTYRLKIDFGDRSELKNLVIVR